MAPDMQPALVPIHRIVTGRNPRSYFDTREMDELIASVRESGVLQPILVRPLDGDRFELVAGERRVRALRAVKGDDAQIIAMVKTMSDEQADIAALVENIQRASMSPTEEAAAAAKLLGRLKGDRDECARVLGWTRAMLDSRLALMNCSAGVQGALNERKLKLGHAELLATLPKDKQDVVLAKMLTRSAMPTVQELKASLQSIAKALNAAIFDRSDCATCPSNSGNQRALFGESLDDGHCTNPPCFDQKTEEELNRRRDQLKDDYPSVRIVRPGENFTVLKLVAEGPTGVGGEQAKACRASCANFGAAVSAVPEKLGAVYKELCFDPACNAAKVAAQLKSTQAAAKSSDNAAAAPVKPGKKAQPSGAAPATPGKSADAPSVSAESTAVREYRENLWRTALGRALMSARPEFNRAALIALLLGRRHVDIDVGRLREAFDKLAPATDGASEAQAEIVKHYRTLTATPSVCEKLTHGIAATMVRNCPIAEVGLLLGALDVPLEKFFTLDEAFLKILTKSEITAVAEEVGLKKAMGEKFAKAVGGKKDELIKALLALSSFNYAGALPSRLRPKKES